MRKTKKVNILITGASGFVGRALIERLRNGNRHLFLVSRDEKFRCPGATVLHGDLSDEKFCRKIVKNIDLVYYLAGYKKNIEHHTRFQSDFIFGNVRPLMSFLQAVRNSAVKKLVYLSSVHAGLPVRGTKDGYLIGKHINELVLASFAMQYGLDIKIVRSAGIYGSGDCFDSETANFIPSIIGKVHANKKQVEVWGSGKRKMQFVYIDDLISNLISISSASHGFFVVGNNEALTVNQIVGKIVRLSGKNIDIKNDTTKPDKPTQLTAFHNAKPPKFNLETGLKKTIAYYKKYIEKT